MRRALDLRIRRYWRDESEPKTVFPCGLKTLVNPPGACLDVVFVHGLTGDRERTWTSPEANVLWPQDLLPSCLPFARITTFGYDAYITRFDGQVSTNRISDHSSDMLNALIGLRGATRTMGRPIIFIAHSLGGLVCKDALRISRDSLEIFFRDVYKSVHAIAFIGTPHAGSWLADWARIPIKALGLFRRTDNNLISILQTQNEVLIRIQESFLTMLRAREAEQKPIFVTCFFETLPLFRNVLIVQPQSAIILGYNKVSVHAHHRDIARFRGDKDPGYRSISSVLLSWTIHIQQGPSHLRQLPKPQEATKSLSSPYLGDSRHEKESSCATIDEDDSSGEHSPLHDQQSKACLASLAFPGMTLRQSNIEEAATNTCQWLQEHSKFRTWFEHRNTSQSHGIFWIKGKPGAGKSTLLKHIYGSLDFGSSDTGANAEVPVKAIYYFNARGTETENSPLGFYRSLLYQLGRGSDYFYQELGRVYSERLDSNGVHMPWTLNEVREIFHRLIKAPGLRAADIFVDALDECHDDEVRAIVRWFSRSAAEATKAGIKLRICWTSRHYPHISVKHSLEVHLEDHNDGDIAEYIRQQLESSSILSELSFFAEQLRLRAKGVFLWVQLMIIRLTKAADQGYPVQKLMHLLEKAPDQLDDLFTSVMETIPQELSDETLVLVQWVLFKQSPMRVEELHAALTFSSRNTFTSLDAYAASLKGPERIEATELEREEHIKRYITERSGGLMEIIHLQFQEVEDYDPPVDSLANSWTTRSTNRDSSTRIESVNEEYRANISRSQLREIRRERDGISKFSIITPEAESSYDSGSPWRDVLTGTGPRAVAIIQVIHESARKFLLSKYAQQVCGFRDTETFSLMSHNVLFSGCEKFYKCVEMQCALSASSARRLFPGQLLTLVEAGRAWSSHPFAQYIRRNIWLHFEKSIKDARYHRPTTKRHDSIRDLCRRWWAIELCMRGVDNQSVQRNRISTSLWHDQSSKLVQLGFASRDAIESDRRCAEGFHIGFEILLHNDVKLGARSQELAFVAAAHHGLVTVIKKCLQQGIDINCTDLQGYTALHSAIDVEHTIIAQYLLMRGADPNYTTGWEMPLFTAARKGSVPIVELLIHHGANIKSINWAKQSPLHVAALVNDDELISRLISRYFHADIDIRDQYGDSPLHIAAREGNCVAVAALIVAGANIEAINRVGNTPLIESARAGCDDALTVLLSQNPCCDHYGALDRTALFWAASTRNVRMTKALLKAGALELSLDEGARDFGGMDSSFCYHSEDDDPEVDKSNNYVHFEARSRLRLARNFVQEMEAEMAKPSLAIDYDPAQAG